MPGVVVLPAGLLDTDPSGAPLRRLVLQVRIFLDLPQQGCTAPIPSDGAWLAIMPTSSWTLPHDPATGLDLARFPAALTGDNGILVVLPQGPTSDELAAGLSGIGDEADVARVLREVGNSFLNYQVVAKRESEQRAELSRTPDVVATVPYFEADIHDLAGLLQLGEQIWR